MKTNIINSKKADISESEILQTKPSFNSLYSKFLSMPAKAFLSKGLIYGASGFVTIATVITLIVVNSNRKVTESKSSEKVAVVDTVNNSPFVKEPIAGIGTEYKEYTLNSANLTDIETCKGTKISVPENAFVYKDGSPVEGSVTLKYREFHNPLEIFRSGIPMNYDSAGQKYVFESAGMIELLAFKGNEPVFLADNKHIDIKLHSDTKEDKYNVYYLDTVKRNWVYLGRDIIETQSQNKNSNQNISGAKPVVDTLITAKITNVAKNAISEMSYTKLIKPALVSEKANVFKVDYDVTEFPELSEYKDLLFEVTDNNNKFNKEWYTINWNKIFITHTSIENIYKITLQKKDSVVKLNVRPVFNKKQYEAAMKIYNNRQNEILKQKEQRNEVRNATPKNAISATTLVKSYTQRLADANNTTRAFRITEMGIYNCDRPLPFPFFAYTKSAPVFVDNNTGATVNCKIIHVATTKANILLSYLPQTVLGYSKKNDNVCFVITYDEKIGIVNPIEFLSKVNGYSKFNVKVYSSIEGIQELDKLIKEGV